MWTSTVRGGDEGLVAPDLGEEPFAGEDLAAGGAHEDAAVEAGEHDVEDEEIVAVVGGGGEAGGGDAGLVGKEGFDGFKDLLVEAGGEAGLFGLAAFAGPAVLEEGEDGAEGGDDGEPRPWLPGLPHVFPPRPIVDRFIGGKPS
jgi:hypothetical protein